MTGAPCGSASAYLSKNLQSAKCVFFLFGGGGVVMLTKIHVYPDHILFSRGLLDRLRTAKLETILKKKICLLLGKWPILSFNRKYKIVWFNNTPKQTFVEQQIHGVSIYDTSLGSEMFVTVNSCNKLFLRVQWLEITLTVTNV